MWTYQLFNGCCFPVLTCKVTYKHWFKKTMYSWLMFWDILSQNRLQKKQKDANWAALQIRMLAHSITTFFGMLWPTVLRSGSANFESRGSVDGIVVRALASHWCGPGSILARCHIWVDFVVGSRLTLRCFLRVLRFSCLLWNYRFPIPIRSG